MQRFKITTILMAGAIFIAVFTGCSSVSFTPVGSYDEFPSKPKKFEVQVLEPFKAGDYHVIGTVSCQDSARSSIWNWWTDQQALIMKMKENNLTRLLKKVRGVGGDVLIGLTHEMSYGGSAGGVGVGMGVGVGNSPVGVGVGTSLFSGNPKIIVVSYGSVGVEKSAVE